MGAPAAEAATESKEASDRRVMSMMLRGLVKSSSPQALFGAARGFIPEAAPASVVTSKEKKKESKPLQVLFGASRGFIPEAPVTDSKEASHTPAHVKAEKKKKFVFPMKKKSAVVKRLTGVIKAAQLRSNAELFGLVNGFSSALPGDGSFQKVAASSGIPAPVLKAIYMSKRAYVLPLIGAGLAAGVAAPAVYHGLRGISQALSDPFGSRYGMQYSPQDRQLYNRIYGEAMRNRRLSSDLQAISGAYRPAPSPWGAGV
jgi:succinate dehydrogenase/fumarate reductase cytochrome b subunit